MISKALLIANRGEIAVRIIRTASELGMRTVAVFSGDDARSLHTRKADEAHPLQGKGVTPYLDIEQIIAVAKETGCDVVHPGYGFLAENAGFARRCTEEGITFVVPRLEILDLFGDKGRARALAERLGVPVLRGTWGPTTPEEAKKFFQFLDDEGIMMIKAVAGGGGRGVRVVHSLEEVEEAYVRFRSEAQKAFGNADLYVEELMPKARHIEVQIIGDASGAVSHLWKRDCSLQRRHQKLLEIAPSPGLSPKLRDRLTEAAVKLAEETHYNNLGTFEFLVEAGTGDEEASWAFIEANARLQVEHTVTEEVLGLDLVKIQLQLAFGQTLAELGLGQAEIQKPRGFALQVRVNMESMNADGHTKPSSGTLSMFELAEKWRLPVVFFTEGGGGRPGDTDKSHVAGLDCLAFNYFARLSGLVPLIGITSGRCFAGNAVLLGCCDVIIATAGSNIGVGGPAMIEGGGLGVFRPEEVGPMDVQVPNGVVDIPVADEAEAVRVAKKYLSYFQSPIGEWECADQRLLRGQFRRTASAITMSGKSSISWPTRVLCSKSPGTSAMAW